ncbi:RsmE family RNA methyltransferase [Lapidilactobacillus luobeiensis]|uniref:RsmE family RNA methyltransferase n=1 Tax=Lapidilactobacillus luobeiensis TaxID=2950371 RepID=UPI0021C3F829|nr:RsmE family RNA methyltransferase [Lapidilactobacillus luobeiensis]
MQLLFVEETLQPQQTLVITGTAFQHVIKVLRLNVGAPLEIVGCDQLGYGATITAIDLQQASLTATLGTKPLANTELPVQATIICGLPKGEKAKLIVQKATELGAATIVFFPSQRAVMRWKKEQVAKKIAHLQQIALSAAEQSHRRQVPQVAYWSSLHDLPSAGLNLVAYEEVVKNGQKNLALAQRFQELRQTLVDPVLQVADPMLNKPAIRMIFGPEGGLAPEEMDLLAEQGVRTVGLGPRILRTETAPLYFLSSLSYAIEVESLSQ